MSSCRVPQKIKLLQSSQKCEEAFSLLLPKRQWLAVPFIRSNSVPSAGGLHVKGLQMPVFCSRATICRRSSGSWAAHTQPLFSHTRTFTPYPSESIQLRGEQLTPCAPEKHSSPSWALLLAVSFLASPRRAVRVELGWCCCAQEGQNGSSCARGQCGRDGRSLASSSEELSGAALLAATPYCSKMVCVLRFENLFCLLLSRKAKRNLSIRYSCPLCGEGGPSPSNVTPPWTVGELLVSGNL